MSQDSKTAAKSLLLKLPKSAENVVYWRAALRGDAKLHGMFDEVIALYERMIAHLEACLDGK